MTTKSDDIDVSVLRTPIPTSVTGFLGVMKAFGDGTAEVKDGRNYLKGIFIKSKISPFQMRRVLERECDIIYECKVCRNIFRDVANLMTHKRLYCKAAFNSTRDFHFPDNGFKVSGRLWVSPNLTTIIKRRLCSPHRTQTYRPSSTKRRSS